jgi:formylglycine-generating enzyme required for sulfatase activity
VLWRFLFSHAIFFYCDISGMKRSLSALQLGLLLSFFFGDYTLSAPVSIDTVPIGNPNNPADIRYISEGVGSVPYRYRIGKTEVTYELYIEFLNAVAKSDRSDQYALYLPNFYHGIVRNGSNGNYSYSLRPPESLQGGGTYYFENKPAAFVSFSNAMRFANWMHNGQPTGPQDASTTEDGAYTLNGAITVADLRTINRNASARWWVPNEDEWYKAAYFDPELGVYYEFATGTNVPPDNNLPPSDSGNSANYARGEGFGFVYTEVGAYTLSASPFGTLDQNGNVYEWNETKFGSGFHRGYRGGSVSVVRFHELTSELRAAVRFMEFPIVQPGYGFRLATVIPEPSTLLLMVMAGLGLLFSRRTRNY